MKLLAAHVIREIAVRARRDPRTVVRRLRGQGGRDLANADIDAAMRALGLEPPHATPTQTSRPDAA